MSDCGGDPNCPECAKARAEYVERESARLLKERERILQRSRVQDVEKAHHLASHWNSARAGLLAQGYTPAQALAVLSNPTYEVCSSGCVHRADRVRGSTKTPKGTKPRERKWTLRP